MSVSATVNRRQVPVAVIGTGAAGLACALALAPTPVLLLTKTAAPAGGSSLLSQGGIAAALGPDDSPSQHAEDTVRAGAGLVEHERAQILTRDGADVIRDIIASGFPADRDRNGALQLGREGAHGIARIVHAGGDATGRNLIATLLSWVQDTPSIQLLTSTVAVELLVSHGRCAGLLAYADGQGWLSIETPNVVLATGGCGALWLETTNPAEATGDGLALAARAGARLADLEFMQFHPTALLPSGGDGGVRLPLLTEAFRGAGARLLDTQGHVFMADVHPLGDLAPRDVVARAIAERRQAGSPVYLDLRPALASQGEDAFPQGVQLCRDAGFEPTTEPVPVAPAAHYHMGGVLADGEGRTTLPGLWACGEVASTGVHGANRLASNSLLEALVWGRRLAKAIGASERAASAARTPIIPLPHVSDHETAEAIMQQLRTVMSRDVGIGRDADGLNRAGAALWHLEQELDRASSRPQPNAFAAVRCWSEVRNALLTARLIAHAAVGRWESRGAHFRRDAPAIRPSPARHHYLSLADLQAAAAADAAIARNA